jgi:hypothetical protein
VTPRRAVLAGIAGAVIALVLFFPTGGGSTDIFIPRGGPDPNEAFVSSTLLEYQSEGGLPGTDTDMTAYYLLWRRMATLALAIASVPLVAGLVAGWVLRRRAVREKDPTSSIT